MQCFVPHLTPFWTLNVQERNNCKSCCRILDPGPPQLAPGMVAGFYARAPGKSNVAPEGPWCFGISQNAGLPKSLCSLSNYTTNRTRFRPEFHFQPSTIQTSNSKRIENLFPRYAWYREEQGHSICFERSTDPQNRDLVFLSQSKHQHAMMSLCALDMYSESCRRGLIKSSTINFCSRNALHSWF